ncbi:flagellar export protein FliJ [Thioalkalicoccus limnaeus]|uniref:Flagellar FliJ protein n=1 Tax=Thioalkalicoccus limnaeus TaxID=120681 RepID=A0ABV4BBY5_9GAMM
MSRKQRIEHLKQFAEDRGQDAARALADRRRVLEETDGQLNQLIVYRDEYTGHTPVTAEQTGANLRDYWRFMSRLNTAIVEHRERIDQQRIALEQSFCRWQESQREVAILDKVIDRLGTAERRAQERQGQRIQDDLSSRYANLPRSDES